MRKLYLEKSMKKETIDGKVVYIPCVNYYKDKERKEFLACNTNESRPNKRNKYVMLNCYKWRVVWLSDNMPFMINITVTMDDICEIGHMLAKRGSSDIKRKLLNAVELHKMDKFFNEHPNTLQSVHDDSIMLAETLACMGRLTRCGNNQYKRVK